MVSFEHKEKANTTGRGGAFLRIIPYRKKPDEERSLTMKNFQNLLYFVARLAMLVVYVFVVSRHPGTLNVLYLIAAGLAVTALAQIGSDWLESRQTET